MPETFSHKIPLNYVDSIDMQNDNTVKSYSHLIMKHFW